ncbi:MAG TPA: beta-ketoacyl synthase N-terminal-like domain-containing protein [Chthoniobacterales bacterium]
MTGPAPRVAITGMGVICSIASDIDEFRAALRHGRCGVRQLHSQNTTIQVGATLRHFDFDTWLDQLSSTAAPLFKRARKILANTTDSTKWSVCSALQAVLNSGLNQLEADGLPCGLIVAGSNLALNYTAKNWRSFSTSSQFNPRYAMSFWDTNQLGCLSDILSLHGPGMTVGAAAASGNAAIFQAFHWLRAGIVKRCLVVGAGVEFSELELEGFALLGAAFCDPVDSEPDKACRPFDRTHAGFVFGEGSASVVLESLETDYPKPFLGEISGASLTLDGTHLPEPTVDGEVRSMQAALSAAELSPNQIGYLNAHGTGTPAGDRTECHAIKSVFQEHVYQLPVNSTKALTGHCFSASAVIELVACILQLNGGFAHPNRNLENPIDPEMHFLRSEAETLAAEYGLSNSFGFGGINSSVVIRKGIVDGGRN